MRSDGGTITYQPALDGLRAVAVLLVLVFHLGTDVLPGGYLGVSVFFTLSGYLISTLLIAEWGRTGRIGLAAFYARRARRLLPASLIVVALVAAAMRAGWVPARSDHRASVFGALFQVQNWVALFGDQSYADLFAAPSPLDHFWSLAIEEQFYWLWPLVMIGLARLAAGRSVRMTAMLGAGFAVTAAAAPLTAAWWSSDATYLASWARAAEILAGAVLAALATSGWRPPAGARWWAVGGLATIAAAAQLTPAGRGWAYRGGLPLFALVSAATIAGLQVAGPARRALSWAPLVWVGRVSYGVYLIHWPVYVVLSAERTGWNVWLLTAVRLTVTTVLSILSYRLLERPIRHGARWSQRSALAAVPIAVVASVVVGAIVAPGATANRLGYEADVAGATTLAAPVGTLAPLQAGSTRPPEPSTPATPATPPGSTDSALPADPAALGAPASIPPADSFELGPPTPLNRPLRMLVIGDSTAQATGNGLVKWSVAHPDRAMVEVLAFGGCGVIAAGERTFTGEWSPVPEPCTKLIYRDAPVRLRDGAVDLAVIVTSFWDVTDHRWPDDSSPSSPLDAGFATRATADFIAYNRQLLDEGRVGRVAWVLYPATDFEWSSTDEPSDDPARHAAFHTIIRAAAAPFAGQVAVIDLAAWAESKGLTRDQSARPDGIHWTADRSERIAATWLGESLINAALGA